MRNGMLDAVASPQTRNGRHGELSQRAFSTTVEWRFRQLTPPGTNRQTEGEKAARAIVEFRVTFDNSHFAVQITRTHSALASCQVVSWRMLGECRVRPDSKPFEDK